MKNQNTMAKLSKTSKLSPGDAAKANRLYIRSAGLTMDLQGSTAEIRRAYQSLRAQLVEQFYATMSGPRRSEHRTLELPTISRGAKAAPNSAKTSAQARSLSQISATKSAPPALPGEPAAAPKSSTYVNLVICEAAYRKMYLLDKARFEHGFLNTTLKIEPLKRIYLNAKIEKKLRKSLHIGSTLWRELTAAGRATFEGSE